MLAALSGAALAAGIPTSGTGSAGLGAREVRALLEVALRKLEEGSQR